MPWWDVTEWGTVSEVAGAIGTVLAFMVAFILLGLELRERRRQREAETRAQARLVAAWLIRTISRSQTGVQAAIELSNRSDEPVYDVDIGVEGQPEPSYSQSVLPPGQSRELVFGIPLQAGEEIKLGMKFTDNAGVRWTRSFDGAIRRRSPP